MSYAPHKGTAAHRVMRALSRLSRERWIGPKECFNVAFVFAEQAGSLKPHITVKHALAQFGYMEPILAVGLLRGRAPAYPGEPGYLVLLDHLRRAQDGRLKKMSPEMAILFHHCQKLGPRYCYGC